MRTVFFSLAIALIIAAVLWYAFNDSQLPPFTKRSNPSTKIADMFVGKSKLYQYSQQGTLSYETTAESITHYANNSITDFVAPRIQTYQNDQRLQSLSAKRGRLLKDGKTLQLFDHVVIKNKTTQGDMILHTSSLTIHTDIQLAETSASVFIQYQRAKSWAQGMHAYYGRGLIFLNAKVRGTYEYQ